MRHTLATAATKHFQWALPQEERAALLAEAEAARTEAAAHLAAAREQREAVVAAVRQREAAAEAAVAAAEGRAAAAEESERQLRKEHAERQQRCATLCWLWHRSDAPSIWVSLVSGLNFPFAPCEARLGMMPEEKGPCVCHLQLTCQE